MLKQALTRLEQKLAEARAKSDMLLANHRRARALERAVDAQQAVPAESAGAAFDRMRRKVNRGDAVSRAKAELLTDDVEERLAKLEDGDEIDRLLADLKARRGATA